jgi:hypothetical protein
MKIEPAHNCSEFFWRPSEFQNRLEDLVHGVRFDQLTHGSHFAVDAIGVGGE